jgi:hypothetical protein
MTSAARHGTMCARLRRRPREQPKQLDRSGLTSAGVPLRHITYCGNH